MQNSRVSHLDLPPAPALSCVADCAQRREASHRVANHLTSLNSYVRLKRRQAEGAGWRLEPTDARLLLQSLDTQIRAMSRLHRLLTEADGSMALANLVSDVCGALAVGSPGVAIHQAVDTRWRLHPDQVLPVSQLLTEALTNALKYAFPDGRRGKISVTVAPDGAGRAVLDVRDDGQGLPADFDLAAGGGFGLRLMRQLAGLLGPGLRVVRREPGLSVSAALQLHEPEALPWAGGEWGL